MARSKRGDAPHKSAEEVFDHIMDKLYSLGTPGERITYGLIAAARDLTKGEHTAQLTSQGATPRDLDRTRSAYDYMGTVIQQMFAGPHAGAVFPEPGEEPGYASSTTQLSEALPQTRLSAEHLPSWDLINSGASMMQVLSTWATRAKWLKRANKASMVLTIGGLFLPGNFIIVSPIAFVTLFVTKFLASHAFKKVDRSYQAAEAVIASDAYRDSAVKRLHEHDDAIPLSLHKLFTENAD